MLVGGDLGLFDIVLSLIGLDSFEEENENAKLMQLGSLFVKVLLLEHIIHSKRTANRDKDRLVLPVLEDSLKVI